MRNSSSEEMTVAAAAALLDRSPETIRRWVWSGRLPARKSGRQLLVPRKQVEALGAASRSSMSLRAWGQLAERVLRRPKAGGRSASDLVIADRRARA